MALQSASRYSRRPDRPIGTRSLTYRQIAAPAMAAIPPPAFPHSSPARPEMKRSEEHTSELQSLMRISYAVFCLKKKKKLTQQNHKPQETANNTTTTLNQTTQTIKYKTK